MYIIKTDKSIPTSKLLPDKYSDKYDWLQVFSSVGPYFIRIIVKAHELSLANIFGMHE